MNIVVIYDTELRPDTTGTYVERALRVLGHEVRHHRPMRRSGDALVFGGYRDLSLEDVDFVLYVDDDINYPVLAAEVPTVYWCIDTHRMDLILGGGSRWDRVRACEVTFFAQRDRAVEAGAPWLPLAFDPDTWYPRALEKEFDWCFCGNVDAKRADFLRGIERRFPRCFVGNAYGEEANRILNSSWLALNVTHLNDVNMRFFEAQATEALLLSNRVGNGEDSLFGAVEYFDDAQSCAASMAAWLGDKAALAARSAAQVADVQRHTYASRMGSMLANLHFLG